MKDKEIDTKNYTKINAGTELLLKNGFYVSVESGAVIYVYKSEIIEKPNHIMKDIWCGRMYYYWDFINQRKCQMSNGLIRFKNGDEFPSNFNYLPLTDAIIKKAYVKKLNDEIMDAVRKAEEMDLIDEALNG